MKNSNTSDFGFGTQIRKSPFFNATIKSGAKDFSVYNHMYIPRDFGDPEENFWNLVNHAILCDVSVERQVEIYGPDAEKFVQKLTPRDISNCKVGQCKYVLIIDNAGGILNDPVLIKRSSTNFWLSLADSDILLWAKGVALNSNMDVTIREPDVSPLQLQGPKSREIVKKMFGEEVANLKYYWFKEVIYNDIPLLISRTGWSSELGYEIFLKDGTKGFELWNAIMKSGKPLGLKAGHTSSIRRIEGGMLSYHADMTSQNNPYEMGLDRLVDIDKAETFIGKESLMEIRKKGISKKHVGILLNCPPLKGPNTTFWPIILNEKTIGYITSAVYSPRLKKNIALAMISIENSKYSTEITTIIDEHRVQGSITSIPFFDPKKSITKN